MSQDLREVQIPPRGLQAVLGLPDLARGLVVFAHGSGSGRLSPRNRRVAAALQRARFATLLLAAAEFGADVAAVVSRGGRPDLAGAALEAVTAPTLLIVGSLDTPVVALNRQALERLRCDKAMSVVPGAGHLFEEPGTLDAVVALATAWFERHLPAAAATPGPV